MDGNEAEQQKLQLKREQLAEQEEDLQDKCDEQREAVKAASGTDLEAELEILQDLFANLQTKAADLKASRDEASSNVMQLQRGVYVLHRLTAISVVP